MEASLHEFISHYVPLNSSEQEALNSLLSSIHLMKGDVFLEQGKSVHTIAFITSGLFEMYKTDERGTEISLDFLFPGSFATDYISYLTQTNCEIGIRAIQPTRILLLHRKELDALYDSNMKFQKLGRILAEQSFIDFAKSIRESFLPVEERYQKLVREKPHWIQEIPQYKIASFLNITPEWLSKIRSKYQR